MERGRSALTVAFALALAVKAAAARADTPPDWAALGKSVVTDLAAARFAAVEARFDKTMKSALPAGRLVTVWSDLIAQAGAFEAITGARVEDVQSYHAVLVSCRFARGPLDARVVFDANRQVSGLFFVPATTPTAPWESPPYARPDELHERQVVIGSAPWQLPGTLTLPAGKGPFPGVVLVHGSGPSDADETIGPNKPFKDLAWGLASRGVAVLRYVKRTAEHGAQMKLDDGSFTVEQETVADARLAIALLATQPKVDRSRVFVLGHSLGGMLAPRIAQGAPVAGIVVMAGNTRPLQTLVVEQLRYLAALDPAHAAEHETAIRDAERAAREIESPDLQPRAMVKLLGATVPGSYFLDLRGYEPARVAASLGLPILVLRGERDYQVLEADFAGWRTALAGNPRATFRLYPGLDHLFMQSTTPGTGPGTPADYDHPGNVAPEVVAEIASWITGLPAMHAPPR